MNFSELRAALDDMPVDLSPIDRDSFINDGHRDLCVRSEWTQKRTDLGPTVANQEVYAVPADLYRMKRLDLNGKPLGRSDEEQVLMLKQGQLVLRSWGVYYFGSDATGNTVLNIYPGPAGGLPLTATYVFRPVVLSGPTDEPSIPEEFHRAVVSYCYWQAHLMNGSEPDLQTYHQQQFEAKVAELTALKITQQGVGVVQGRIAGIHV